MIQEFTEQEVMTMKPQELVEEYLNRYEAEHEEFSERRQDEQKTFERCLGYIQETLAKEYEEQAKNGRVYAVWHTKVFDLAVQYYATPDLEYDIKAIKAEAEAAERKANAERLQAELKAKQEKKERKQRQKDAEAKATLFDVKPISRPEPKEEKPKAEAPIVQMQPKPKPQAKQPVYTEQEDLFLDFFK